MPRTNRQRQPSREDRTVTTRTTTSIDDQDIYDERGILRDGQRLRVRMNMMDAAQRAQTTAEVFDGIDNSCSRPGHRYAAPPAPASADFALADAAQRAYDKELADAWR